MLRSAATQFSGASAPEKHTTTAVGMDISVLERQKAFLQRLYQQQHEESRTNPMFQQNTSDLYPNYDVGIYGTEHHQQQIGFGCAELTSNSHSAVCNSRGGNVSSSTRKRKAEFDVDDDEFKEKGAEREGGEVQSEITAKTDGETSTNNSSKESVKKPDYIHVRARRGQATDSHSLAERARREKISKKMKYLQDLVPGCNKVTGKAGMLDEIINYVQSLQKQVEFLSMKLAALNPRLDFSIDDFFAKEIPAYIASFPTQTGSSLQYNNQLQQGAISCGFDIAILNPSQILLPQKEGRSPITTQVYQYHDSSSANANPITWDAEWHNLFNAGFH